ncbi:hypothetical protein COI59_31180 [Bacillus toyonensis]|nr:hypothetical protein COI59_31180 [Bacillus toyonensis]
MFQDQKLVGVVYAVQPGKYYLYVNSCDNRPGGYQRLVTIQLETVRVVILVQYGACIHTIFLCARHGNYLGGESSLWGYTSTNH